MGKASRRKRDEAKEIRQSFNNEKGGSSALVGEYAFFAAFLFITAITFLVYSNTFSSPFHFDDTSSIVENYQIRDLKNLWPPSGSRYIGVLSFALNYHFNKLNVFGYHLINIIIHIINGLLVWRLVILTFKTPVMERTGINPQLKYLIALTSSLIFISHPIQTQAVTYIVQRFASLSTLFYVLSLALYIETRLESLRTKRSNLKQSAFYFLSLIFAVLSMKTKEISFTLPFVVILYEFMFFNPPLHWGQISNLSPKEGRFSLTKRFFYLAPFLLTFLIIPLSIVGADKPIGDMIGELREAAQETESISRGVYLLTQFRVIVTYIRLLFLPINQNLDYDYPLSHSFFEPATFLSFLFLLSIFGFAVYLAILSCSPPSPLGTDFKSVSKEGMGEGKGCGLLISFGILWFFITLSVESSIIPIRDVIFEHRLYLPMVGAMIAFASVIFWLFERWKVKNILLATCVLLLVTAVPLGIAAYERNFIWKDEVTLWEDMVEKSPNKARGYNNLGAIYYKRELLDQAIIAYKKELQIEPNSAGNHYDLGNTYYKKGDLNSAEAEYKIAKQINPNHVDALIKLGNIYLEQDSIEMAISEYNAAVKIKPDYDIARMNLGVAYAKRGLIEYAIKSFKEALKINPNYPEAHNNLGLVYYGQRRMDEAITEFQIAIKSKFDYAEAYNNLGAAYQKKGLKELAITAYEKAVALKPEWAIAKNNLRKISGD